MNQMNEILAYSILGNTVQAYVLAAGYFLVVTFALMLLKRIGIYRIKHLTTKTKFTFDDTLVGVLEHIGSFFYFAVALFAAVQHLALPSVANIFIKGFFLMVVVHEVIKVVQRLALYVLARKMHGRSSDHQEQQVSSVIAILVNMMLWSIGLLLILSNLGFNVTSLLAGLGIGGLAISLALQNILGDMFSSFSIAFDKPFKEGDFIIVGDHMGVVKHIGLKTTRIEALQGEEIVISNNELTSSKIHNFKKMERRRISFLFGVAYDTPSEKLEKIGAMVEEIVRQQDNADFDRSHFKKFGDSTLDFETVYYITSSDYNVYMDTQQAINIAILRAFEKEEIEMAFPTRTIYMKNDQ